MDDVVSAERRIAEGAAGDDGAAAGDRRARRGGVRCNDENFVFVDDVERPIKSGARTAIEGCCGAARGSGNCADGSGGTGYAADEGAAVVDVRIAAGERAGGGVDVESAAESEMGGG